MNRDSVKWSAQDVMRVGVKYTIELLIKVGQDDMGMYRKYTNFQPLQVQASVERVELTATTSHEKHSIPGLK
jgi:hypothetical protein